MGSFQPVGRGVCSGASHGFVTFIKEKPTAMSMISAQHVEAWKSHDLNIRIMIHMQPMHWFLVMTLDTFSSSRKKHLREWHSDFGWTNAKLSYSKPKLTAAQPRQASVPVLEASRRSSPPLHPSADASDKLTHRERIPPT